MQETWPLYLSDPGKVLPRCSSVTFKYAWPLLFRLSEGDMGSVLSVTVEVWPFVAFVPISLSEGGVAFVPVSLSEVGVASACLSE